MDVIKKTCCLLLYLFITGDCAWQQKSVGSSDQQWSTGNKVVFLLSLTQDNLLSSFQRWTLAGIKTPPTSLSSHLLCFYLPCLCCPRSLNPLAQWDVDHLGNLMLMLFCCSWEVKCFWLLCCVLLPIGRLQYPPVFPKGFPLFASSVKFLGTPGSWTVQLATKQN